jgi:glycosyltransferase involved in cell wall biosynthesis
LKYHDALKAYLESNFSSDEYRLISKKPLPIFKPLQYKGIFNRFPELMFLNVQQQGLVDYDLYHSFYQSIPANIERTRMPKSLTFLDLIPLRMNGYSKELMGITKRIVQNLEKNYAICISEYSRIDLLNYNKRINPERVFTAPLAASADVFFHNMDEARWMQVKTKYKLPDRYFLCVSSSDFRKNIPHLIRAFRDFILQEKPRDIKLLLTGNSLHSQKILEELNIEPEVRKYICMTDRFIDEEDLSVIYSRALCFFFMSLYEGFGLPLLEAMQCGTPVVSSQSSSLPEVVGDAGILLDPTNLNDLSESMRILYEKKSLRTELSAKGLERSALFSWEKTADTYLTIFNQIKAHHG